jgi:hypothetical protein
VTTNEVTKEFNVTSEDFQKLRHKLVTGMGSIRTAFNRLSRNTPMDERVLSMYESGLEKLLNLVEEIDTTYLVEGEKKK